MVSVGRDVVLEGGPLIREDRMRDGEVADYWQQHAWD